MQQDGRQPGVVFPLENVAGIVVLGEEIGRVKVEVGVGGVVPLENRLKVLNFQGNALEPPCDPVNGREARPHTPGHGTELLPVAGVALPDNLVEIRRPLDRRRNLRLLLREFSLGIRRIPILLGQDRKTSPSSFFKPPLGELEILPVVEDIEQPVFQLLRCSRITR